MRAWLLVLVVLLGAACTPALQQAAPGGRQEGSGPATVGPRQKMTPPPPVQSGDPYVALARTLHRHGVQVWFEADLVRAWQAGPEVLRAAAVRLGQLARATDVTGFKIADELGYGDGIESVDQGVAFLRAADHALQRTAPGKPLLVDAIVPDLGCLPWRGPTQAACAARARSSYPAADEAALTRYLHTGVVDRLDLSTGLLEASTYVGWGTSLAEAQRDAWEHVRQLGWARSTSLQSRKALAAPGGYAGDASQARSDLAVWVDAPLAAGAAAVDVWTWRQPYDGQTVSLLPASLRANPLWDGLAKRNSDGAVLMTHMTPSAMPAAPAAVERECALVARAFAAVFVAAGTG